METLPERLKRLRQAKGLTQIQVQNDLGLGKASLTQYENGKMKPGEKVLAKLAVKYEVSVPLLRYGADALQSAHVGTQVRSAGQTEHSFAQVEKYVRDSVARSSKNIVAKRIGVSQSLLSRWLSPSTGKRASVPTGKTREQIIKWVEHELGTMASDAPRAIPSANAATVGQRLREARHVAGLTQAEVSARLGLGANVLSEYERDQSGISDDRLLQLANLYGVDAKDLAHRPLNDRREDAFYDGILYALQMFNQVSGQLLTEVREGRQRGNQR